MTTQDHIDEQTALINELGKDKIATMLDRFISKRPGLDPRNYGAGIEGRRAYDRERADITRQLRAARKALRWFEEIHLESSFDPAALGRAFVRGYSGRLTLYRNSKGAIDLDYCAGQYGATEYRAAARDVIETYRAIVYDRY